MPARGAVPEPLTAFRPVAGEPLVGGAHTHPRGVGRFRDAKPFVFDAANQDLAAVWGESGILVDVHAGSSKADGLPIRISFGHRARMNNLLRDHN